MSDAQPLTPEDARARLAELPGWELDGDASVLRRTYRLPHLSAAILAVHIAEIQNELNHHSDLTLGYDTLAVTLTTHSAGGRLTGKDFALATRIAAAAGAHGAS
jgi:4a-hydroxytetrahydrobiopterin dehydratase